MTQPIFDVVPKEDYLGFRSSDGQFIPKNVVEFLDLKNDEVAKAANVSEASVRYDERMPEDLKIRILEIGNICQLVAREFKGDRVRTATWFKVSNPYLGNISPRDMIRLGRYKKLYKILQNLIAGNVA